MPDPGAFGPLLLILLAVLLVGAVTRRVPVLGTLVSVASWLLIAFLLLTALGQREAFDPYLGRLATFLKIESQEVVGGEVRIRQSPDGHFWARVKIGGVERRMLIDSGATVTAVSESTAAAIGVTPRDGIVPVLLTTANGTVRAQTGSIEELRLGAIVARDLSVVISPAFGDVNVIGMNFLSRLKSWRVEGRTLILVPHHPQPVAA
jgi:aspartyl protease family protein